MAIEAMGQGIQSELTDASAALAIAAIKLQIAEENYRIAIAERIRIAEEMAQQCMIISCI